jgi:hypothetical protein
MFEAMAYSLQQALEGLGVNPTHFEQLRSGGAPISGSVLNVQPSLLLTGLVLIALCLIWLVLVTLALRALWGSRGLWSGLLLLLVPGLMSGAGAWPQIQWLPRTYLVGSGQAGSPRGMLLLQTFAMSAGWALTVWITRRLKLDDRFRHGYDQFWYALAISAGLFFVADLDGGVQRDDFRNAGATSRAASGYLLGQLRRLDAACETGAVQLPLACQWASNSQWQLEQYAYTDDNGYWQVGPEEEWRVYASSNAAPDPKDVDALRLELLQYNAQTCPVVDLGAGMSQTSRVSRVCQMTPPQFCTAFPARALPGVKAIDAISRTVAIGNECIVPTLLRLKSQQSSLAKSVDDNAKAKNLRTLFFVLVSFIAGGKVANASVRMTDLMQRVRAETAATMLANGLERPAKPGWDDSLLRSMTRRWRCFRNRVQKLRGPGIG